MMILLVLLGTATAGCEILDNLGAGFGAGAGTGAAGGGVLPQTTAIIEEAKRLGRSPYDVLTRRYELKYDALTTSYKRERNVITAKKASGSLNATQADAQLKLLELEHARETAELDAAREIRKSELDAMKDLFQ